MFARRTLTLSQPVYRAVSNNLATITGGKMTPETEKHDNSAPTNGTAVPPLKLYQELSNVVALHIRRGDYEGHCWILRHFSNQTRQAPRTDPK